MENDERCIVNSIDRCLSVLSEGQRKQVLSQVRFHLEAPSTEQIQLSEVVSLRLAVAKGVTRPMSSKTLARWLWQHQTEFGQRTVLDIGTGCGIQGLTCLLGGAKRVVFSDLTESAIGCAASNLRASGLARHAHVVRSDLFDSIEHERFDLIVFAQPFFAGIPIPEYEFTRGMLDPGKLVVRFFARAREFLNPGGRIVMMAWDFAGDTNNPLAAATRMGFRVVQQNTCRDDEGIQRGDFRVVVFE